MTAETPRPWVDRPSESASSIWLRRALSVPSYLAIAVACLVGAPFWLLATMTADVVGGRGQRWPRTRALGFFALYLACEVAGVALATLLWVATLGGRVGGPARYLEANAALQRWWSATLFSGSVWLFSMKVQVEGLELARSGPLLLFARHASAADTILAAALVANPKRLLLRYVLKRELLWDPCLDIVGRRLPNTFVDRSGARSRAEVDAVARLGEGLDARSAVLIYPEGTRFTAEKLARGVEALRGPTQARLAAIASSFRHVLPPRLGGALALLEAAPGVDLLLLEHTGFEGAVTFAELWRGGLVGQVVRVRLRRFAADTIPKSGRDEWLFERWAELDAWVASHAVGDSSEASVVSA
jgi:1-acyl-sn-glycerol-3-phosphate acyltransferase